MCGIVGIVGEKATRSLLLKMLETQNHRGPDNTGLWNDSKVAIGHNRLSIIDLSEEANQPFFSEDKRYVLTFNGEIYNFPELKSTLQGKFKFKTNSDTEVLLASYIVWGKNCLSQLNGMFSFAIYDTHTMSLFAARDRFGVKPFYYGFDKNTFFFSSEIKALHVTGIYKKPNAQIWANYFAYGSYGWPSETFWEGIEQLPGGHYLELVNNKLNIVKWYDFVKETKKYNKGSSFEEVKENYTNLLRDSIKLRFRADVPIGFNISGGLDSSTLLAFVNMSETLVEEKDKIKAFTFYTGHKDYDELPWVEEMVSITRNPLHRVLLSSTNLEDKIKKLTYFQDEPFGGIPTIAYSEIFREARKNNVKVLLDGQGMDEQWAGYDYYNQNNNSLIQGVTKSPFKKGVLEKKFMKLAKKPEYPTPFKEDLLNKQYRDLFFTKIPRALRFNDRASMAYSTELREPFLDYRLVEYAFSQPREFKIKNNTGKFLLREIVADHLSDNITYAPKRPLQTPQREWLAYELKDYVQERIKIIQASPYGNWFNEKEMNEEWLKYKNGDNDSSFHIWQWLSFSNILID